MKTPFFLATIAGITCLSTLVSADPSLPPEPFNQRKKVIEYGWDVPSPASLAQNLGEMQKAPFDGVIYRLDAGSGNIFMKQQINAEMFTRELNLLKSLNWGKFKDNFIITYAKSNMAWESESDWEGILAHIRALARIAKETGARGIAFDPEPYGSSPWHFAHLKNKDSLSRERMNEIVHQRGEQFIEAIQSEMPQGTLFLLFGYGFMKGCYAADSAHRAAMVDHTYIGGLYLPFLNGILEKAGEGIKIVDGYEQSYDSITPANFFSSYAWLKQVPKSFIPEHLYTKYATTFEVGQAVYVDKHFLLDKTADQRRDIPKMWRSSVERLKDFEELVYLGLRSSDRYVWIYSERMNWWTGKGMPEGLEQSIERAKERNRETIASDF